MPIEKTKGKAVRGKVARTSGPVLNKSTGASILGEISKSANKNYKFYLTAQGSPNHAGNNQQLTISGTIQKIGGDWIRVRESSGYKEHKDQIIPLASILYFTENYSGE